MNERRLGVPTASISLAPAVLLAVFGLAFFVSRGISPWSWPSLDMATFYANFQFGSYISGDFVTSCFGESNGRAIFGKLTAWPISLGLQWHQTLYLWMLFNSAALPFSIYLGLAALIPPESSNARFIVFSFVLFAIVFPGSVNNLTVAWWSGWSSHFHPSVFSIATLFFGSYLILAGGTAAKAIGYGFVFLSALLHPAYAINGGVFIASILLFREGGRKSAVFFLSSIVLGLLFIKAYSGSGSLGADDYYRFFALLHPEHYIPSRFVAMGQFSWYTPVIFLLSAFAVASIVVYKLRQYRLALLPAMFFLLYGSSLVVQYVFVELYPISATVMLISPARFSAFGYWMLAVSVVLVLHAWVVAHPQPAGKMAVDKFHTSFQWVHGRAFSAAFLFSALVVVLVFSTRGMLDLRHPINSIDSEKRSLIDWIRENTDPSDEIASPGFLPVEIPLLTGRGSYSGNGFPFEDRCLEENYARYTNINGDPTGPRGRLDAGRFYAQRDLQHFSQISPRPQWVVMDRSSPGAVTALSKVRPAFQNRSYIVFRIGEGT